MSTEVLRYLRRVFDDPTTRSVADADLLQRFTTQRDESAFELLLWRHAGMVLSVCRAILRDHHLAEDAFQATFLALARKAGSIGRRDVVAGWLYRVAHNAALKARGRHPHQELVVEPTAPADHTSSELGSLLHEELGRLPDKYRTPLVLGFLEGLSHADAARQLGWPKGTVAGRVARARELLRQRLTRRGVVLSAILIASAATVPQTLVAATSRAALVFAGDSATAAGLVSAPVLRLTQGVLNAMFLSKIKSLAVVLGLVGCVMLTGGWLGGWALGQKPGSDSGGGGGKPPPVKPAEDAVALAKLKTRSVNNLKHIALAIHNYHDAQNGLPGNASGPDKKPLLSWRVLILPYLEQEALYRQFKLDEPWDSEHNLKLLAKMPDIFRVGTEDKDATSTIYQGFADERSLFPPGKKIHFKDVTDGLSNTIMVIEAGTPVPWTKPADLPSTSNKPLPKLGGPFKDAIHAAFGDGAVHTLKRDFDEKTLRLAITRDGGEPFRVEDLQSDAPKPADPSTIPTRPAPKDDADAQVKQALYAAQIAQAQAAREAARATEMVAELKALAQQQQREAVAARAQAEKTAADAEVYRLENDRLKKTLMDVADQIAKLVPSEKPADKPMPVELKALAAELEQTQQEMRRLRDEVDRLKKLLDK